LPVTPRGIAPTIFSCIYLVFGVSLYAPKIAEPSSANVAMISIGGGLGKDGGKDQPTKKS